MADCICGDKCKTCIVKVALNLKELIQGFYIPQVNLMVPVLFIDGYTTDFSICDTITVELHSALAPYSLIESVSNVIHTNGSGRFVFNAATINQSYYIAVRHRNSVETWSKTPLLFNSTTKSFDFTTP